ncbi:MAG: VOC family protein [Rhizobiales bacterium]|nr:VOC family protein [Hyphomicrobiales bacterium]
MSEAANTIQSVHHIGMTVASLEAALAFWENFLGKPARWTTVLNRPYLGRVVGIPDVAIRAAFVDLPGGGVIELLDYQVADRTANTDATANPGNVHLCLQVSDAAAAWRRAVDCGAVPISPEGPVAIDGGPNLGAQAAYLRIHDGITMELFQPPRKDGST